jgi:group I intron endonuclease
MHNYTIYKITSPSGKSYIGQTSNFNKRMREHASPSSKCRAFNNAIQKYGWDMFVQEYLAENLTIEEANKLEEHFINEHKTLTPNGYNLVPGGLNHRHSDETKRLLSVTKQNISDETRLKLSEAGKRRIQTEETRQKIRKARLGSSQTEETRQKRQTEEYKKIFRDAHLGKIVSEETRQKISKAKKGRVWTDEQKTKLKKPKVRKQKTCTRCGLTCCASVITRWHNEYCKAILK